MTDLHEHLIVKTRPMAHPGNMVVGKNYRITVLTERLIRVEKQANGVFTDDATQFVWNRDFSEVKFAVEEEGGMKLISTSWAKFYFDPLAQKVTQVFLDGKWVSTKNGGNLGGTCRTLDREVAWVPVEKGLLSKKGVACLQDTGLLLVDGEVKPRKAKESDEYIFAYGRNYRDAINDYFYLTGETPMLPRYVLGNWWSRYHAYTQEEYLKLFREFEKRDLPFTVATIDMDWHWVKVNEHFPEQEYGKYGALRGGWTGYSWNTDLFPDHKGMLKTLHDMNLHITMNLHPAQGVRCFENCYEEMAKSMDMDPKTKQPVAFDITNTKFINSYFDIIHHPMEEEGVDFWWMDWQQGKKTKIKGLDPLWSLNHYHYLDSARDNKRGMLLSRYCGIGSHRYPLGFSGDTFARWSALRFQPEFTAKASNIGFGWWSHDIGGHMMGFTDDDMYTRWCQLGTFSPINRLHSSTNELQAKEPWKHSQQSNQIVSDFLRLRHALIPYLYTASYEAHTTGKMLCEPMYYAYPWQKEAYKVPNQFTFGTQLIVSPIVEKVDKRINMAKAKVWLPEGIFTDIFTGRRYKGGRTFYAFRDLETMPVFAKEGAILPLSADEGNGCGNPTHLKVWVYRGNGSYNLYEDDGISQGYKDGKFVTTAMEVKTEENTLTFTCKASEGDLSLVPSQRKLILCLRDLQGAKKVTVNGTEVPFQEEIMIEWEPENDITVTVNDFIAKTNGDTIENAKIVLSRWQKGNHKKLLYYQPLVNKTTEEEYKKAVRRQIMFPRVVRLACEEVFLPEE